MNTRLKRFSFTILFNLSLFMMLMVGIQNSSLKSEVKFLTSKTVNLPISFIIGVNFIAGSLFGNFLFFKKNTY
mgnify:CR=1 FL=1